MYRPQSQVHLKRYARKYHNTICEIVSTYNGLIVVVFVGWRKVVFHTKVNTCTVYSATKQESKTLFSEFQLILAYKIETTVESG